MRIAVTGATGFIGRYIVRHLIAAGQSCRCWHRPNADRSAMPDDPQQLEWIHGQLDDAPASAALVEGCDAVVHGALHHPGGGFRGGEGDLCEFVQKNVLGTIRLIEAARAAGVPRFVFISTCAVHERILDDRPLDEAHPLWPTSHYGAHKAAIEKFVHSFGLGQGYAICSLRPTGVYGLAHPASRSKWYALVQSVRRGDDVEVRRGGKEVHAADVARAVEVLLHAPAGAITGEAFNCYDMYIHEHDVATIARDLSNAAEPDSARSRIVGEPKRPRHQIDTAKLRALGMQFGGRDRLVQTVRELLAS